MSEKFIKFYMSKGPEFSFKESVADKILNSKSQIIRILNDNKKWTGETLNKAHIISTKSDFERNRKDRVKNFSKLAHEETSETEEVMKAIIRLKKTLKEKSILK